MVTGIFPSPPPVRAAHGISAFPPARRFPSNLPTRALALFATVSGAGTALFLTGFDVYDSAFVLMFSWFFLYSSTFPPIVFFSGQVLEEENKALLEARAGLARREGARTERSVLIRQSDFTNVRLSQSDFTNVCLSR